MKKQFALLTAFLLAGTISLAQHIKKETSAIRINVKPYIDGILDDETWRNLPALSEIVKYYPYNGKYAEQNTEVKICYDD